MIGPMRIDILTLFPEMFRGPFDESIIRRAIDSGKVEIRLTNFRDFATDRHRTVDDAPYGGGAGMVLKPGPIFAAVESVTRRDEAAPAPRVILMSPQGRRLTHRLALEISRLPWLVLLCGHYEGFDERIREHLADDEISIGDYVLTGGELAAMVFVDAVVRLAPGVIAESSPEEESFSAGLLEYPHYTRPPDFRGWQVPEVLLSGHHAEIARWRREQAILRTARRRPDLLAQLDLSPAERALAEQAAVDRSWPEDA